MYKRTDLIKELRQALHLAESPNEEVLEFDIGDTCFCFEFQEQSKG